MTRVRSIAGAASLLFGLSALPVQAESVKQQCAGAFEDGQRFRIAGDLQRAILQFESCRVSSCPAAAQRECSRLSEVAQSAIPTIHFELTFGAGLPRRPVMLSIDDGEPAAYDGEVLRVNPGKHRFAFECQGCAAVTRKIEFVEQDAKRKEVALNPSGDNDDATKTEAVSPVQAKPANGLPAGASSATASSSKSAVATPAPLEASNEGGPPLVDIVIFGSTAALATAGAIGFVSFSLEARSGERALAECTPDCSDTRIDQVKRNYWLANVSLGTGLLALGGATIWWFSSRPSSETAGSSGQWSVELGPINKLTRTF